MANVYQLPKAVQKLTVSKFLRLKICPSSIVNAKALHTLSINSIPELALEKNSFSKPDDSRQEFKPPNTDPGRKGLNIRIQESRIEQIPTRAFVGRGIIEIHIINSTVNSINQEAFFDLSLDKFYLTGSKINEIESDAFVQSQVKKFQLERNSLTNVQNNAFNVSVSIDAVVQDNDIETIKRGAFSLNSTANFKFSRNTVKQVQQHAFELRASKVDIEQNTFHHLSQYAFLHIRPAKEGSSPFTFSNNTVYEFNNGALCLNEDPPQFQWTIFLVKLHVHCTCQFQVRLKKLVSDQPIAKPKSDSKNPNGASRVARQIAPLVLSDRSTMRPTKLLLNNASRTDGDPISGRHGETSMVDDVYQNAYCYNGTEYKKFEDFKDEANCQSQSSDENSQSGPGTQDKGPSAGSSTAGYVLPSIIIPLLATVMVIVAVYYLRVVRKRKAAKKPSSAQLKGSSSTVKSVNQVDGLPSNWIIAIPDTRVYKETEFRVAEEYATPLEEPALILMKRDSRIE